MENKDLTGGERKAVFILKNENKTYAEIAKLLKNIKDKCLLYCEKFRTHIIFIP
jgi:hypothetical protein